MYKRQYQDKPTVVMGDLNANPDESPIKLLSEQLEDSFKKLPIKDPIGTFSGFDQGWSCKGSPRCTISHNKRGA